MARWKDGAWDLPEENVVPYDAAAVAVLMDIRDRLDVLRCADFRTIPDTLRSIERGVNRKPRAPRVSAWERHRAALRKARKHR